MQPKIDEGLAGGSVRERAAVKQETQPNARKLETATLATDTPLFERVSGDRAPP